MMNNQDNLLIVSSSPHLHSDNSVSTAMRDVLIALTPALIASLYFFRFAAAKVILTCVFVAVISEVIAQKIMKKEVTVDDYSAVVTGLLLAFCLPATIPWWMAAVGAVVAIIIGKQLFGGLGNNIFNPALVGRAVLLASWPVAMTNWVNPLDGVTTATPLGMLKEGTAAQLPSLGQLFIGNVGGSLGETCALALLLGAIYLLYKGHIDWRIPFSYLGTVFVLTAIIGVFKGEGLWYPLYHLLAGGLILGAFFMATDWVTSPLTKKGKFIFGLGCGLLTVVIRLQGGYPEGVCYSILLMNMVTPLIDRYTKPRVFGGVSKNA
ncbi:MAG: RnfABCDGE type electron transport complex subunit D [Peptococcia bacterium]|jgi:electron transport complex protein RnfD